MRHHFLLAVAAMLFAATAAQAYPDGPIRMIIPLPAGTGADIQARLIGDMMGKFLARPFVYENKVGAQGELAVDALMNAAPDGRTVGYLLDGQMATRPAACLVSEGKLPYDPARLEPIGRTTDALFFVGVGSSIPDSVRTLSDLVAYSKTHIVQFGSGNPSGRLGIAEINRSGAKIQDIPYKGELDVYTDLMAGRVAGLFSTFYFGRSYLRSGKLRALAVVSATGSPLLPDVPAATAEGFGELAAFPTWSGLFGPPRLPKDIVATLNGAAKKALADATVADKLASFGFPVHFSEPRELGELVRSQYPSMAEFFKAKNDLALPCR